MRVAHWLLPSLVASFIAFACSSPGEEPGDAGSGGQATGSGGSTGGTGGGSSGGMGGGDVGSGGVAVNPETGLPVYWEVVLDLEEDDVVKIFDDGGIALRRYMPAGEYTDDLVGQSYYLAPGADALSPLTVGTYVTALTDDANFLYVTQGSSDGPLIGRIRKPTPALGLGGAAGESMVVEPLLQSNIDSFATGVRVNQSASHVFFLFYMTGSLTTVPEAELWSVDKISGASTLIAEDFPPFTGQFLVVSGAVHFVDTGYREIHSVSVTGGAVALSAEYPSGCDLLIRNDARDGWWASCEGTSTTDLVTITPQGQPILYQSAAAFFPQTETQSTPTYLVSAAADDNDLYLSIFDTQTSTSDMDRLLDVQFVAVVDGYAYVRASGFLVRAALEDLLLE